LNRGWVLQYISLVLQSTLLCVHSPPATSPFPFLLDPLLKKPLRFPEFYPPLCPSLWCGCSVLAFSPSRDFPHLVSTTLPLLTCGFFTPLTPRAIPRTTPLQTSSATFVVLHSRLPSWVCVRLGEFFSLPFWLYGSVYCAFPLSAAPRCTASVASLFGCVFLFLLSLPFGDLDRLYGALSLTVGRVAAFPPVFDWSGFFLGRFHLPRAFSDCCTFFPPLP